MSKLTKADVLHVANLAKLNLTDKEVERYLDQLSKIVEHISGLSEVDTNKVDPTSQTTGLVNATRQDVVNSENCLTQEEALSGAETYNGYFKVDAILAERTDK